MEWWSFDKEDGIVKYVIPKGEEPKSNRPEEAVKDLGFSTIKTIEIGESDVLSTTAFQIYGHKSNDEVKVPFQYLFWVRVGFSSFEPVFVKNFPDVLEFLKYMSGPARIMGQGNILMEMLNSTLNRIAENVDSVRSSIDDFESE